MEHILEITEIVNLEWSWLKASNIYTWCTKFNNIRAFYYIKSQIAKFIYITNDFSINYDAFGWFYNIHDISGIAFR